MDNNNPTDPNAGQPVADAPMGGSVYTPPAAPVEPVVPPAETPVETPAPETPAETPVPLGDQPTPGEPVV